MIPNHFEFLQLLEHHVLKTQVSPFTMHHFQSLHEKTYLQDYGLTYGALDMKVL
jgi:hypothetical protein